jgi:hypothetical protein
VCPLAKVTANPRVFVAKTAAGVEVPYVGRVAKVRALEKLPRLAP